MRSTIPCGLVVEWDHFADALYLQQGAAMEGISASGCGLDIRCICGNGNFLAMLQGVILQQCDAVDQNSELCFSPIFRSEILQLLWLSPIHDRGSQAVR